MSLKLKLKDPNSCDGCSQLKTLNTIGGHKRCEHYKKVMLPFDDVTIAIRKSEGKGTGKIERPQICKDENEVEVTK